ncbi:MAG: GSCFA domain-containing protein [Tannerella sp.]|nr:GSCFA domain-containing protein [Tannerella sp.]
MISYCTPVKIAESPFKIQYKDRVMFMGSCFADHIGTKMSAYRFRVHINPFGVLYNPLSVSSACRRMLNPEPFIADDLFLHEGLYHSFAHHGRFSDVSAELCLNGINESLSHAAEQLRTLSYLAVTFGTANVYRLKKNGSVVANCHKLPASGFVCDQLTVDGIIREWSDLFHELWRINPSLKIIFTVSPIRHLKDGAHPNQISKATLLLAEQALTEQYPGQVLYFPAYEIMMDELRDYRFYAEDMIHPSSQAVDYIWERFGDTCMDRETYSFMKEVDLINKNLNHKPFHPEKEYYKQFLMQTLLKIRQLRSKNPYICLSKEEEEVERQLKNF